MLARTPLGKPRFLGHGLAAVSPSGPHEHCSTRSRHLRSLRVELLLYAGTSRNDLSRPLKTLVFFVPVYLVGLQCN